MKRHKPPTVFGVPMIREEESGDYAITVGGITAAICENNGLRAWVDGLDLDFGGGPKRRTFQAAANDIERRLLELRDAITKASRQKAKRRKAA